MAASPAPIDMEMLLAATAAEPLPSALAHPVIEPSPSELALIERESTAHGGR